MHEARYGIGWAQQNQGQYDEAVNAYNQVTDAVATELAAQAQLNIGLCRLAQKRYADAATALLVVPFTYDYPELSALALLEAARALQREQADGAGGQAAASGCSRTTPARRTPRRRRSG